MPRYLLYLPSLLLAQLVGCADPTDCDEEPLLERTRAKPSVDQFQELTPCLSRTFDLTDALSDDGSTTIAWLLEYQPDLESAPDAINTLTFTFDPCTNPRAVPGTVVTLEAYVLNQAVPLAVLASADQLKAFTKRGLATASVIWFIGIPGDCQMACQ
jgi:hypothetical protein